MLQKPFSVSREQFCFKTFQLFEESLRKFPSTFLLNVFLQPLNLNTARVPAPVHCRNSELCYAASPSPAAENVLISDVIMISKAS